jgi:acetyltransferase-like isoleucine patch superfamily enzyme
MLKKIFGLFVFKIFGGLKYSRWVGVKVGEGCRILTNKFGTEPWLVEIGSNVTISNDVQFINHDGIGWLCNDQRGRRYRYAKISVGNNVFIGARSVILPGVRIDDNCIVGSGSVVTRSIPAGFVVAGVPAKVISRFEGTMAKASKWPSSTDQVGENYRERVDSICDVEFNRYIET